MKPIRLLFLLLISKSVQAHTPDLSNLMIYEQNEKYFLIIKSSLTAFENEIDYVFGKNSYQSPQDFQMRVLTHFRNNCIIMINDDTVNLAYADVRLGHETTLFATLANVPKKINSIYINNSIFKDMPFNISEIILMFKDLPQKQLILSNNNFHEVKLKVEKNNWTEVNLSYGHNNMSFIFLFLFIFIAFLGITTIAIKQHFNLSN